MMDAEVADRFQLINAMLPKELLQRVLELVAVEQRLAARPGDALRDTYRHLARVCRHWRDALRDPVLLKRVKQRLHAIGGYMIEKVSVP